ncbi:MAG: bifunctional proline dehydrogenase/L-glutamate gamma-semialdehyde dehydrogenase [Nocardioides sp.]|uniref:bifunctional proline dehydrogenase/L-glutamate gamma-semialdehyde dehydrogenase n=1 Tax=Nocardioides sp. TaxID=35761 RepID=UPI003F059E45
MSTTPVHEPLSALADEVEVLVRRWLDVAAEIPVTGSAAQLAGLLKDPRGLDFTVGFIDGVIRPEDPAVAAAAMVDLAADVPDFLPLHLRTALKAGAQAGRLAPGAVVPVVRAALRHMVGHLLVDATPKRLGSALATLKERDVRLNLNLLGEAVLGSAEADRRLAGTRELLARDDVDYVSIKVSSVVGPHSPWAYDEAVAYVVDKLEPLYRLARDAATPKFINLDMEEYRDLDLTIDVFTRVLDQEEFRGLEAGIVLQAYLPDALAAMVRIQEWAAARVAGGGAPVKVRVVKGANLPMEHVEADLHGWPVATWSTKQESDTHYKRVLDYALRPEHTAHVRVGVAGHNLFDIAFAWLLAKQRGVVDDIEFEMLLGMAEGQAEAVRRDVGGLLLYTPVVRPSEFDVAIAYLIRRLEEGASTDNFMSAVFELHDDAALFERERARFRASLAALDREVPGPNRTQDRRQPVPDTVPAAFANTPDTDPSLPGNRAWGRAITDRIAGSVLGEDLVAAHTVTEASMLEETVARTVDSGWGALSGAERAAVLRRAAVRLEQRRGELLEVMASECGKTLDQSDPEVSEAIDFATYYADLAEALDDVDGATAHPVGLTLVTPPWNFPVAIPAGSTLAALAAGSPVVVKPAPQAARCGSLMVETVWQAMDEAGVGRDALALVHVAENDLGRSLVADPRVDRLILTGAFETAELFRSFRPDVALLAETSGKNAMVITPSADLDLAAKDLVASAFGHAGQKCSAASLVIVVGSVATSRRFRTQLVDAVSSLHVARPDDPTAQMGPVIEPARGKLLRALTTLAPGESWLVQPRQLDDSGTLWSPGVKEGVARGSEYHLTEYFGPVLGIIEAATLAEAVEIQNQVDYGLTAGLHSLDPDEIAYWLAHVEAGNAYVNRGTTGAIVRRQPFGGWKKSAVGNGTKAGGPHYLKALVDWTSAEASSEHAPTTVGATALAVAGRSGLSADELSRLERSVRSDAEAWATEFGVASDVSGLRAERNVFRYATTPVQVRLEVGGSVADLLRVLAAGAQAGGEVEVSTAVVLPEAVTAFAQSYGMTVSYADAEAWRAELGRTPAGRIRLLGGSVADVVAATGGRPDVAVWAQPVTEAGLVELLPFLREQAVSVTAHRFGTPNHLTDAFL